MDHPGTRPERWWQFTAPGPRVRIGGVGTPCAQRLAHVDRLYCGVPVDWITAGLAATFEAIGRPLGVPSIDPGNPPIYESEAAFLDRLDLLLPAERRRLREADFAPERITDILNLEPRE